MRRPLDRSAISFVDSSSSVSLLLALALALALVVATVAAAAVDLVLEGTAALALDLVGEIFNFLRRHAAAIVPLEARLTLHASLEEIDDVVQAVAAGNLVVIRAFESGVADGDEALFTAQSLGVADARLGDLCLRLRVDRESGAF